MTKEGIIGWCNKIIDWLFLGVVFLTPVYFAYFAENVNVFELNKLLIVRLGVSLVLFLTLLKISLGAELSYYRSRFLWLISLGILLVYVVAGVVWSVNPSLSFLGNYGRQQGVYSLLHYWLFFVLLLVNLSSFRQVKGLIYSAIWATVPVVAYGIAQHYHLDPQPWQVFLNRSFSSLGQPNFLGHYLAMMIPITATAWWLIKSKVRYAVLILLIVQLACLLFTMSRGAWLGLLPGVIASLGFWAALGGRRRLLALGGFFLGFFLLICGWLAFRPIDNPAPLGRYAQRMASIFDKDFATNKSRWLYWTAAFEHFAAAPKWRWLVGFGKDSQAVIFTERYHQNWGLYEELNAFPDRAHNLAVDCLLEFGLIGCLILAALPLWLFGRAIRYLWRERQTQNERYYVVWGLLLSVGGYFFTALFGFPLTTHYLYYYLCLALLVFIVMNQDRRPAAINFISLAFKWTMTAALIFFVTFFFYFLTIKAFVADCFYMLAKRAEFRNDCGSTLRYANHMLNYFAVSEKLRQDYVLLNVNCLPFVSDEDDRRLVAENILEVLGEEKTWPFVYSLTLERARAYAVLGVYLDAAYYERAEKIYQSLIAFNSDITFHYQDYARMKMWSGDYAAAERIILQGLAVTPSVDQGFHQTSVNKQRDYFNKLLESLRSQSKLE